MDRLGDDTMAAIVEQVEPGSVVVGTGSFAGGLSSWMSVVDITRADGTPHRLVVRRGRRPDAERNTLPFRTEFALLLYLESQGIPVARPRHFDDSGRLVPQAYLVLDFVPGTTPFVVDDPLAVARRMAEVMARYHGVDTDVPSVSSLPRHVDRMEGWIIEGLDRRPSDETLREDLVRRHLLPRWPPPPSEECLLHADLFPGNVVWHGDDIAAVIDWESAALGDPMADVATTRLDLLWIHGPETSETFTSAYLELTGRSLATLGVWELVVSLRPAGAVSVWAADMAAFGRADITAETMRTDQHAFVDGALRRLAR